MSSNGEGESGLAIVTWDDATWILTSAFIIFTMQTGFGLLESGSVSTRNEVNIMVKNAVDVVFGGLTYWAFGFGFSFGNDKGTNGFCGWGHFFVDSTGEDMGILFSTYVFQLSFATTATTIVSGAMAERTKLSSYIIFSFVNTIVYCIPAHWEWAPEGFLFVLGCVDIAGSGAVHLLGGVSALCAAIILKPRIGRFPKDRHPSDNPLPMGNPANTLVGMFMLWWGWLAFNCGSTFGISGGKWKLAAKAAVCTLNGSMGGGLTGIILSYFMQKGRFDVGYLANSILGALVAITAGCAVVRPWEAVFIGVGGGICAIFSYHLVERMRIDDPVGAIAVHGVAGVWGMLSVGLFAAHDPLEDFTKGRSGLFHGGGFYLLGVQALACVTVTAWSAFSSTVLLLAIHWTLGLRMSPKEEKQGADYVEHGVGSGELPDDFRSMLSLGGPSRRTSVVRDVKSPESSRSLPSLQSIGSIADDYADDVNLVTPKAYNRKAKTNKVIPISVIPSPDVVTVDNIAKPR